MLAINDVEMSAVNDIFLLVPVLVFAFLYIENLL